MKLIMVCTNLSHVKLRMLKAEGDENFKMV